MVLDRLAPDQRAVVQLVLAQERSYDDLAGLLGISAEAVRARAVAGAERLAPAGDVDEADRGRITDYLLGQQSDAEREGTRTFLAGRADAREWARAVADELRPVAKSPLPDVPEPAPAPASEPEPGATAEAPAAEISRPERPKPARAGEAGRGAPGEAGPGLVRARPRPRPAEPGAPARPKPADAERRRSSLVGGALLLAGLGLALAALVVFLVNRDGDETGEERAATPTATATASPDGVQPAGTVPLRAVGGGDQRGQMGIFISQDGQVAFTIEATGVPPSREGEAYAVWLTGGDRPRRLGFAPTVGRNGRLGTSGPRQSDARRFARWFASARHVVVSRETTQDSEKPGEVILRGTIPRGG